MSTLQHCKFFYLREVVFDLKGELPVYACERGHDISAECNEACPDFQDPPQSITNEEHSSPKR